MQAQPRSGSVILFALAIVAAGSMLAYAFAVSMRSAGTVSKDLIVTGLAEASARMGARHAAEVVLQDYLADPGGITKPYGPHVTHFMDTKQFDPAWAPNPDGNMSTLFFTHPKNDGIDDIPHDARQWYMSRGVQDQANGLYSWYHQTVIGEYANAALFTGTARYIEPGRYNGDGRVVRFSDAAATPDHDSPIWYGADWRPVATRAEARYRVRYAISVMDLGGHLLWGRQMPYESVQTEWDHTIAQAYIPAIYNLCAFLGASTYNYQSVFLGWGSTVANPEPSNRTASGFLLPGFSAATGQPAAYETMPGAISAPVSMSGKISTTGVGGPSSWTMAERLVSSDVDGMAHYLMTPFGRASTLSASPSKYYEARVSTPWRVNALTAPADAVKAMLRAYMPPQLGKNVASSRTEYPWVGYNVPAWPGLPSPSWGPGTTIAAVGPTPAYGPGVQIQSNLFAPPELSASNPFAAWQSPAYGGATTATTYNNAYPDIADYWEDYAYFELNPAERSNHAVRPLKMLGWFVDVDNDGLEPDWSDSPYPIPKIGGSPGNPAPRMSGWFNGRYNQWGAHVGGHLIEPLRGMYGRVFGQYRLNGGVRNPGTTAYDYNLLGGNNNERPFWHRDSYWCDLFAATGSAWAVAKAQHLDQATCGTDFCTAAWMGKASPPYETFVEQVTAADVAAVGDLDTKLIPALPVAAGGQGRGPNHVRDLDRLFLATLGEYFLDEGISPSDVPKRGILNERLGGCPQAEILASVGGGSWPSGTERQIYAWGRNKLKLMRVSANIRGVYKILTDTTSGFSVDPAVAMRKVANMELVLNDWRMSFFGANPTYTDFRPYDFDGDGYACCSCYTTTTPISGKTFRASPVTNGKGAAPDLFFSLSGYFVFEKGRYWRVLSRGEVFDEVLKKPIREVNLETAFVIDPEGRALTVPTATPETTTLYSRWITNYYRGLQPVTQ